jgi:sec-independent protein translocase protein TatA
MFAFLDSPGEIIAVVVVVVLLFGGSQLPKLARSIGQAQKEFKKGLDEGSKDDAAGTGTGAAGK